MTNLIYDATFEGLLTSIFEIYDRKIAEPNICKAGFDLPQLFNSSLPIITSEEKQERVWKRVVQTLGKENALLFWKAWLSEISGIENTIFKVIRYALLKGAEVLNDYSNGDVLHLHQTLKQIRREKHRMEAFVRFELTSDHIYFSAIEPDFNVLPLIIRHFESRYADQHWVIYDLKREFGIYYNLVETEFVEFEFDSNKHSPELFNEKESLYRELWKDYFKSTNIVARKNMKLHVRHIPKRYWKYLTEKKD